MRDTAAAPGMQDYQIFGLRVRSELALPELLPAEGAGAPDVVVRRGQLAGARGHEGLQAEGDELLLSIPDVARYRISDGAEILVDAEATVPDRNIRLFLLGSAFGALFHQRGLLPLHANAVVIDGRAAIFMGASGAGKSTLAAWFQDQGLPVLADDVCVVGFGEDGPFTSAGVRRLRLSRAAVEARGLDPSTLPQSYVGDPGFEKFDVPAASDISGGAILPLAALYVLEQADQLSISKITGVTAAEQLFAHTYRGGFVRLAGAERVHWSACVRLVSAMPIFRFARNWSLSKMNAQNLILLEHARAIVAEANSCR